MKRPLRYVIGLTGLPSSGKGEVAAVLVELAERRGWRAARLVFSDQIREEARRRGIPDDRFNRDILSRIGTELRETEGPGVLALRIARAIESWPAPGAELFVADGLRHPGEIDALQGAFDARFILIAVESEPVEIARRLIARKRVDESPDALRSEEKAVALLQRELNGQLTPGSPNVGQCLPRAHIRIPNHGTLEELKRTVERFFASLVEPGAR